MSDTKGEWAVAYKDQGLGHGMYGVVVKETNEVLFEDITKNKAEEIVHRWNSQPDLLEACEAQHQAIDRLFALLIEKDEKFFPSKSGQPWEAIQQGNAAIAIARKEGRRDRE